MGVRAERDGEREKQREREREREKKKKIEDVYVIKTETKNQLNMRSLTCLHTGNSR